MDTTPSSLIHKTLLAASCCLALAAPASAFTINSSIGALTDSSGAAVASDTLVVFVVDLNGDGVEHPTSTSFAPGADDFILGTAASQPFGAHSFAIGAIERNDFDLGISEPIAGATIDGDDPLAAFWFPELTNTSYLGDSGLTPGETSFGAYNTVQSTPDSAWVIPSADSDTVDRNALTSNLTGNASDLDASVLQAQFSTSGVVIPEPSSALLALLGSFLCFRRRRA